MEYVVTWFVGQCLDAYESDESDGVLAPIALKVLMKVLRAARIGRCGILRATTILAKHVTKRSG